MLKPHKQLSDAFRNASQVYKNFIDVVIKTSHSAIKTICFIEMDFTLLFYANDIPVCAYFAPAHQQPIIT